MRSLFKSKKSQSGRTMVEMIGVIGLMGVLGVGGIVAYQYGMNSYHAQQVGDSLMKLGILIKTKQIKNVNDVNFFLTKTLSGYHPSRCTQINEVVFPSMNETMVAKIKSNLDDAKMCVTTVGKGMKVNFSGSCPAEK